MAQTKTKGRITVNREATYDQLAFRLAALARLGDSGLYKDVPRAMAELQRETKSLRRRMEAETRRRPTKQSMRHHRAGPPIVGQDTKRRVPLELLNGACDAFTGMASGREIATAGFGLGLTGPVGKKKPPYWQSRSGGYISYDQTSAAILFRLSLVADVDLALYHILTGQWQWWESKALAITGVRFSLPVAPCDGVMHWQYSIGAMATINAVSGKSLTRVFYFNAVEPDGTPGDYSITFGGNAPVLLTATESEARKGSGWHHESGSFPVVRGQRGRVLIAGGVVIETIIGEVYLGNADSSFDCSIAVAELDTGLAGVRYHFEPA